MLLSGRTRRALLVTGVCAIGLAACQDGGGAGPAGGRVEAPGVPVAFETIDGVPEPAKTRLASALASEASIRRIELVSDVGAARYRVRGYLTAYATDSGGTELTFVWDIFDGGKRRAQRLEGTSQARGGGANPWQGIDQSALTSVAATSMDAIASFLAQGGGAASASAPIASADNAELTTE